jgi:biopolymer transport protein TolQ
LIALLQAAAASTGTMSAQHILRNAPWYTIAVMVTLICCSLAGWVLIFWKWLQFRRIRSEGYRFVKAIERTQRLEDVYKRVQGLPETPYSRIFKQGANFFSELRPGALRENAAPQAGLTEAQLNALWLILEKVQDEERDAASGGMVWLAILAVVGPLLGLLGTTLGIMHSFIAIGMTGSAQLGSVAPGIAEALVTTAIGLVAAIPASIAYNYFTTRLNRFSSELEGFASEFIGSLAREGKL